MKPSGRVATGVLAAICLFGLLAVGDLHAKRPEKTITGTVQQAELYRGKLRSVYIEDSAAGDFLVVRSTELGKELMRHVGEMVTATGYIKKTVRDTRFAEAIDVLKYEVVPAKP